jgi:hypothetical protein
MHRGVWGVLVGASAWERRLRHRRPVFVRRHDMYTRDGMRGLEVASHLSGQMIQYLHHMFIPPDFLFRDLKR